MDICHISFKVYICPEVPAAPGRVELTPILSRNVFVLAAQKENNDPFYFFTRIRLFVFSLQAGNHIQVSMKLQVAMNVLLKMASFPYESTTGVAIIARINTGW